MPTYAGVPLSPATPELSDFVQKRIRFEDVCQFTRLDRISRFNTFFPYFHWREMPVRPGKLWWPSGASRWATGFYIATEYQLDLIRQAISDDGDYEQDLVLSDGTTTVTAPMYMLPPRPLAQNPPDADHLQDWTLPVDDFGTLGEPVYLLTLVDERYFWWERAATISVTENTTTWETLISAIGTGLGVTITPDTISADYLKPSGSLASASEPLPLLLDLVCWSIGHRFVRALDGTCTTQTYTTARASVAAQLLLNTDNRLAGGQFAFTTGTYTE